MKIHVRMINVIFDTNAVRDFVAGVQQDDLEAYAKKMAVQFDAKGIRLMISPIVIMELLCHLSDVSDHDYSVSFKAIKALMLTQEYQLKGGPRGMMSPGELLVINEIYHMKCDGRELMYSSMMGLAEEISHRTIDNLPDLHTADGGFISDYVADIEKSFAEQIRDVCKQTEWLASVKGERDFDSFLSTPDQECLLAVYYTRTSYNLLMNEGKLPDYKKFLPPYAPQTPENFLRGIEFANKMNEGNKEVIRRYPAFIALAKEVVRKIHQNKQISDKKLHNFIWDINLMFHINDHTVNKEPFIFVTSDKAMLVASGAFHDQGNVMNYDEFTNHFDL